MYDHAVLVNTSKQKSRVVGWRYSRLLNGKENLEFKDILAIKYDVANYLKEEVTEIIEIRPIVFTGYSLDF